MTEPVPLRPDEQVAGGYIAMTLGGQRCELSVLPVATNRKWTAHLADEIRRVLGAVGPVESADKVADLLAAQAETMMDLLIAYDRMGAEARDQQPALPEREWIDTHATDREVYEALKRVTAAAYPFGPDLLRIVPELVPVLMNSLSNGIATGMLAIASSKPTSGSQQSTAGQPTSSNATSPTSSSPSTPKRGSRGAR